MLEKLKATGPLALSIGILAFLYVEFVTNFDFHWVTSGNLGNGLDLPAHFHMVIPAGFVAWGLFFALGATNVSAREVAVNSVVGCLAAIVLFLFVDGVKGLPDFWAIALAIGLLAFIIVLASGTLTQINVPVVFCTFASAVFWWITTGLDGWAPGASGHSVATLATKTAGSGAFAGVLSTPYGWVAIDTFVTLLVGLVFGMASVRFAALLTPGSMKAEKTEATDERVATEQLSDHRVSRPHGRAKRVPETGGGDFAGPPVRAEAPTRTRASYSARP